MKISVQRLCDGVQSAGFVGPRCTAVLETMIDTPDGRGDPEIEKALVAWQAAAAALGWRATNPANEQLDSSVGPIADVLYVIPGPRFWLSCPSCTKVMHLVCYRCHQSECACVGGPHFSAIEAGAELANGGTECPICETGTPLPVEVKDGKKVSRWTCGHWINHVGPR